MEVNLPTVWNGKSRHQ